MKNRINRLARGVYDYEVPEIQITETSINEAVRADDVFTGEVRIFTTDGMNVRGIVYSDNPYVSVVNSSFTAGDNLIQYKVDAVGLFAGEVIEGCFEVVSDAGEFRIPYRFSVSQGGVPSEIGPLRNMFHFANYVQTEYEKALKLFVSPGFKDTFIGSDARLVSLYDGLIRSKDVRTSVEEFLVATKKKASINLTVDTDIKTYDNVSEDLEDKITITKDNWGYVKLKASADQDFIRLAANNIDSDSFIGNIYELVFHIDAAKLHAGKNFGRIYITTDRKQLVCDVVVSNSGIENRESRRTLKLAKLRLVEEYISFRTKKISVRTWIDESKKHIETIRKIDDSECFYKLAMAHIFLADKKETQAKWLIDSVKDEVTAGKENNMPVYCYYLYVTSMLNKDRLFAIKAMEQIKGYYETKYDDWKILWVLLYLDDENDRNKTLKLIRLKEQYYKGCTSPIMYLEACMILNDTPGYLRVLDEFEIQAISFGCRHQIFNKKAADYITGMLKNEKNITRPMIEILMGLYETFENDEILLTLCEVLIRKECIGAQYFPWYRLGVMKEFKVTKLYEYYIQCIDTGVMEELPKPILLYFMYNSSVDYKAKAYVYANVTFNRINSPAMFENYRKIIADFAREQLKLGHISDNLALIYSNVLTKDMLNEDNIMQLPKILFTYKVVCESDNISRIIVKHRESNTETVYPVNDGIAYVQMYTKEAVLIFETVDNVRYINDIPHRLLRLLDEENYLDSIYPLYEDNQNVAFYFAEKYLTVREVKNEAKAVYFAVLKNPCADSGFKTDIIKLLTDDYYDAFDIDSQYNNLLAAAKDVRLPRGYRVKLLEILISNGEYERAYNYIKAKNVYPDNAKRIYRLTTKLIAEGHDDVIIQKLSDMCFRNRKYDDTVLSYLISHYNKSTEEMLELWRAASNFSSDLYDLSERIIAQSLFTRVYNKNVYEVFEEYYNHGANERVVEAFISYNCYNYFVRQTLINEDILKIAEHRYQYGMEVLPICKMALLLYYSRLDELNDKQILNAGKIMEELVSDDMYFEFYKEFVGKIVLPYNVIDKSYVEYRTYPDSKVTIHYIYENEDGRKGYTVEEMKNVYEGIFVKPFVLFYGQAVQYYITEQRRGSENVTESRRLVNRTINPTQTDSRYEAINDILASCELQDVMTTRKLVHGYAVREYITEEMFKPL